MLLTCLQLHCKQKFLLCIQKLKQSRLTFLTFREVYSTLFWFFSTNFVLWVHSQCMNCMTFYRTLGRFLSLESQNQVRLPRWEVSLKLIPIGNYLFSLKVVYFSKKKALYLRVNVFSMKVLIGDTIFMSPAGDRRPFYIFKVLQFFLQ